MEIKDMQMSDIEARTAELDELMSGESPDIESITAEVEALEERKARIEAEAEARKLEIEEVLRTGSEIENDMEEEIITMEEIRNSKEYIEAYAKYIRTKDDREARSLLTENGNGTLPAPEFVGEVIAEAFKASPILSGIRKSYARGNFKQPFEYGAPIATAHTEGAELAEEELLVGYVNMEAVTWKKWVSVSDEALELMSGENFLRYIYDEIARGIVHAREKAVCDAILNAPQTATASAPAVAKTGTAVGAITDIVNAEALLGNGAEDIVVIVSKSDYATYKGLQMSANYGVDPFDGLTVIKCDYATAPIVGDLRGIQENFVLGDEEIQTKFDDKTLMTQDLVRVLGRMPSAIALVGNNFFAKIAA